MIKIACIGLMAVFLALKLKSVQPEYALLVGIAACIVLFGFSVSRLETIFSGLETIRQYLSVNSAYIGIILKVVGIAYISEFSANLCKDAGYSGIGSQIEMFGKLSILVMSLPILTTLLTTIQKFVGE
ncbi:stage III sporulation protein AD [Frisingicoccus sp.]|uniref:stage III sporulation protein AD n=1 Tax=Frisingicoccus sp. TaxID=1918627 RepID=UPI002EB1167A|nr:stage III sporulation protein AD [Frisingicoccus sp.]